MMPALLRLAGAASAQGRRRALSSSLLGPAVYLIRGQSNGMGDTPTPSNAPAGLPRSDIRCSVYVNGVVDGAVPRSLDLFVWKGVEAAFGVDMADAGRNVAICKWVYNATSMQNNWTPWQGDASATASAAMVSDSILAARAFMDALVAEDSSRQPYIAGVYWTQWESDAAGANTARYLYWLRDYLATRYRADFHPDLPIFISAVSDNFAGDPGTYTPSNLADITAAHVALAAEPNGYILDTDGLPFRDDVHYTADGYQTLGGRLATLALSAPVPEYPSPALTRVSLYTSRAAAELVGAARESPADNRVWAVDDPGGIHYVPTAHWPVAGPTKGARFWPHPHALSAGNTGGSVPDADLTAAVRTGRWHFRCRPAWLSTAESVTRRIFHKNTAWSIYYLGSSKQFNVRMNSVDCLSLATTFNGTTDEFVIDVDFGSATNNVLFYKNGTLFHTGSQANNFAGSTVNMAVGASAFATSAQWLGDIYEPVEGAYTP